MQTNWHISPLQLVIQNKYNCFFLFYTQKQLTLPGPGLYSIHLTAYDKAGNYKTARRFVLYDNDSHVSHNPYEHSRVESGSKNTNYTWIVDNIRTINVVWRNRFRNVWHDNNKWLNRISESHGISNRYDDNTGVRNVTLIKNVYGKLLLHVTR